MNLEVKYIGGQLLLLFFLLSCIPSDDFDKDISLSIYSSNLKNHQSAAVYGDCAFMVNNWRTRIFIYDLVNCQMVDSIIMPAGKGRTPSGDVIYHSNQCSFSPFFYSANDNYPLLYISQRAKEDKRSFAEVYQITNVDDKFKAQLIQTLYFPIMNEENSLGTVNVVFDIENQVMYTYSRNNDTTSINYGICRITKFKIPAFDNSSIYLNDEDIISSFSIDCSAVNMQGACIRNDSLFIGQGIKNPVLQIVNLETNSLTTYDLKKMGCKYEPEGCFWYKESLMISTRKCLYKLDLSN